jgi:hypothetical protein
MLMARTSLSTSKLACSDAKQQYESKTRSRTSLFARATAQGTPTRKTTRGISQRAKIIAPNARSRLSKHGARGDIAEGTGSKRTPDGRALASATKPNFARYRGVVSSIWKTGLDHSGMRPQAVNAHIEREELENEEIAEDEHSNRDSLLREDSDEEWEDERTLIDGLMGFDDQ